MLYRFLVLVYFHYGLCSNSVSPLESNENDEIDRDSIVTIFGQGYTASRAQCAKYTSHGIMVNDQLVHIPGAPDLLFNPFSYPELDDVSYSPGLNIFLYGNHLFTWLKTFYFNSFGEYSYHSRITEINIAGRDDIRQHQNAIRDCSRKNPEKNIILYGVSRGASMTFLSIATLPEEERKNVKMIILEAPFDSVPSVLNYRFGPLIASWLLEWLQACTKYDPTYITPLDSTTTFPLDIPVVFITSLKDQIVHHTLTQNLIDALRERNHPSIYHLMLNESSHTAMSLEKIDDGNKKYYRFIHEIYKKYFPLQKDSSHCSPSPPRNHHHHHHLPLVVRADSNES